MPRIRTVALIAATALLARRALRGRISGSPLWPMPALDEPVSGRSGRRRSLAATITERTSPADGVVQLRLEGDDLPAWTPGAHIDVVLPSGLIRQYSLCGDPAERGAYTIATRRIEDGRGGSREVHDALNEADEVEIRGPRNRFPLVVADAYVFVAGGIGITPILPMLRQLDAAGADWRLLYCGRSRATMPFLDEVEKLGAAGDRVTVVPEDERGFPEDERGFPELDFTAAPDSTAFYCCGPEGLMTAVAEAVPPTATLHLERFAPRAAPSGGAFEVELHRSGRTITVGPGTTVLAAVRAELRDVSYSCEQGFCGTCQQRVLAGDIDHRDELLTDSERDDSMLICVSRCNGERLVLDL
ncbi:PDR/VanB family oxidoreductase [Streptomyces beijiangensis]|uniref:Oxidoreductase n=1 Tax=Streptomyces beijiangensis TaxID=163361 RepID=A0A939F799_9ACTN|nr:PDR/VanB family oxidoreductase [Streptomyces beijiangensis]MBO0512894.1 oxidoreductase [Streptomyces beijiangensis]